MARSVWVGPAVEHAELPTSGVFDGEPVRYLDDPPGRWSHQDWPTGHYKLVEGWPKPLPDTRHSHDGWTWGSFGGVYAENPDRIWVAMRSSSPAR